MSCCLDTYILLLRTYRPRDTLFSSPTHHHLRHRTTVSSSIDLREKSRFLSIYYSYSWLVREVRCFPFSLKSIVLETVVPDTAVERRRRPRPFPQFGGGGGVLDRGIPPPARRRRRRRRQEARSGRARPCLSRVAHLRPVGCSAFAGAHRRSPAAELYHSMDRHADTNLLQRMHALSIPPWAYPRLCTTNRTWSGRGRAGGCCSIALSSCSPPPVSPWRWRSLEVCSPMH